MAQEPEVEILITSDTGDLTYLTKLRSFVKDKGYICELDRTSGRSHCLVVLTVGTDLERLAKIIQSWLKNTGGASVKLEVRQSTLGKSGGKEAEKPEPFALASAFNVLLQANTQAFLIEAVNAYPILLQNDFDRFVGDMIASEKTPDNRKFLQERLRALKELRSVVQRNLDRVSPERTTKKTLVENFAMCWEVYRESRLTIFLDRASELAEGIVEIGDDLSLRIAVVSAVSAGCYQNFKATGQRVYLDRSIMLCESAIETAPTPSDGLPNLLNQLGLSLKARFQLSKQLADIDRAIGYFNQVAPTGNSALLANVADGLRARFEVSRELTDIDKAVSLYESLLKDPAFPRNSRATLLRNSAKSMASRYEVSGRFSDLETAIRTFRMTLEEEGTGSVAVRTEFSQTLLTSFECGGVRAHLDEAVKLIDHAFSAESTAGMPSHFVALTRGNAYRDLYGANASVESLDMAISCYDSAVSLASPDEKGTALANLSNTMGDRYRLRGDSSDLTHGIELAREALSLVSSGGEARAHLSNTLGNLLCLAYEHSRDIENLQEAVDLLRSAVDLAVSDQSKAAYLHSLGAALGKQARETGGTTEWRQALECVTGAYQRFPLRAPERANVANSLAALLYHAADAGVPFVVGDNLAVALQVIDEARAEIPEGTIEYFQLLCTSAQLKDSRFRDTRSQTDLTSALSAYREASRYQARSAVSALNICASWSKLAIDSKLWGDASDACGLAIATLNELTGAHLSRSTREQWIDKVRDLGPDAAISFAKVGKLPEAVVALESTSAILLSQSLKLFDIELQEVRERNPTLGDRFESVRNLLIDFDDLSRPPLAVAARARTPLKRSIVEIRRTFDEVVEEIRAVPGHQDFLRSVGVSEIAEAARLEPLIYLCAHQDGGLALIVDGQAESPVRCVWLPDLRNEKVIEHASFVIAFNMADLVGEADEEGERLRRSSLDSTCRWLWDAVFEPLSACLKGSVAVTLVPNGLLAMLPLHAAWHDAPNAPTGRTYALDLAALSYAPNARALGKSAATQKSVPDKVCIVANPSPSSAFDLPGAEREGLDVARFFESASVLRGFEANKQNVFAFLKRASILHFACHAYANLADPLNSGLFVADRDLITVQDLLRERLDHVRLAVLSACQSGVPGMHLIGEVIGLPTALLQAGATAVIGTMWAIDDLTTVLLIDRFYSLWQRQAHSPCEALRRAQQWLRDTTNVEKLRDVAIDYAGEVPSDIKRFLQSEGLEQRSFSDISSWAAFSYVGRQI